MLDLAAVNSETVYLHDNGYPSRYLENLFDSVHSRVDCVQSFTQIHPVSEEISRHAEQLLTDSRSAGQTTQKHDVLHLQLLAEAQKANQTNETDI